ncbi:MAG TPA: cytochrome c [Methylovirgula sp.]|jgi:mono/diheme cytochrome c family protein|nr:cytochrome c [Methylovirgula sp.]
MNLARLQAQSLRSIIAFAGIAWAATLVHAEDASAVRAGKELTLQKCAPCHAVSRSQAKPESTAPSFEEIAAGPKMTREALRAHLASTNASVRHPGGMPAQSLTENQIDLIFAYLSSLPAER